MKMEKPNAAIRGLLQFFYNIGRKITMDGNKCTPYNSSFQGSPGNFKINQRQQRKTSRRRNMKPQAR